MSAHPPSVFKFANEDWEFEQIHRLNYRTFVEEIPQHHASPTHRLVDKFHAENTYLICLSGGSSPACSLSAATGLSRSIKSSSSSTPTCRRGARSAKSAFWRSRRSFVARRSSRASSRCCGSTASKRATAWPSFPAPRASSNCISTLASFPLARWSAPATPSSSRCTSRWKRSRPPRASSSVPRPSRAFQPSAVNFLPGPVTVRREVRRAFEQAPESHRADAFTRDFQAAKQVLCELVHARYVELFLGSGTLANDVVAGQLLLEGKPGLVLTNGEFGERLVDHARRFGLPIRRTRVPLGPAARPRGRPAPARSCARARLALVRALRNLNRRSQRPRAAQDALCRIRCEVVSRLHQLYWHGAR